MLTPEKKEEYIQNPNTCPYCDSEDINAGDFECDANYGWVEVSCEGCEKRWQDLFTLTGIAEEGD